MVGNACTFHVHASTVLIVKVTRLDGALAIGIQCGLPDQTKVLNLGNQQWSDLERTQRDADYFAGSFFIAYSEVRYSS